MCTHHARCVLCSWGPLDRSLCQQKMRLLYNQHVLLQNQKRNFKRTSLQKCSWCLYQSSDAVGAYLPPAHWVSLGKHWLLVTLGYEALRKLPHSCLAHHVALTLLNSLPSWSLFQFLSPASLPLTSEVLNPLFSLLNMSLSSSVRSFLLFHLHSRDMSSESFSMTFQSGLGPLGQHQVALLLYHPLFTKCCNSSITANSIRPRFVSFLFTAAISQPSTVPDTQKALFEDF